MEEPRQLRHESRAQGNRPFAVQEQYMDDSLQKPIHIVTVRGDVDVAILAGQKKERSTVLEITYIGYRHGDGSRENSLQNGG